VCNSFVIGDLVIDHAIYVEDSTPDHQQIVDETIYKVLRRTDTAGGAANCARILAALSTGNTYLWGLVGSSHWGTFRKILEHSQQVDGSARYSNIELRGCSDETDAQMNTVTRLLVLRRDECVRPDDFGNRFDESEHLHVPPEKAEAVLHYLKRARQKKGELDVIIINDLDKNCLNKHIVAQIAEFAEDNHIWLFVDPKYDVSKYSSIKGTAILPNLVEWCKLVRQENKLKYWEEQVTQPRADLSEMAYLSFESLGQFTYHVIKCDKYGAVFIGPGSDNKNCCVILKIPSLTRTNLHQLGCGDVMSAVFAMEFAKLVDRKQPRQLATETVQAQRALLRAKATVACYLDEDNAWDQMPDRVTVIRRQREVESAPQYDPTNSQYVGKCVGTPRKGLMYLPKARYIALSDHQTALPGWYSTNTKFRDQLRTLGTDLGRNIENWRDGERLHIIVTGKPGCGKSAITSGLARKMCEQVDFSQPSIESKRSPISTVLQDIDNARPNSVLIIDEALKVGFEDTPSALHAFRNASKKMVRLVLLDTRFLAGFLEDLAKEEVTRRCRHHKLSGLLERPEDAHLTVAGILFKYAPALESANVSGSFLLASVNALLDPTAGTIDDTIQQAVDAASKDSGEPRVSIRALTLDKAHLPTRMQGYLDGRGTDESLTSRTQYQLRRNVSPPPGTRVTKPRRQES
jgi:sugar/nucleoside kinase (ribokinase family)